MKKLAVFLVFLLIASFLQAQNPDEILIDIQMEGGSFKEFVEIVEKQTMIKTLYKEEWMSEVIVDVNIKQEEITKVYKDILKGRQLYVSLWQGRIVIFKNNSLIYKLPTYRVTAEEEDNTSSQDLNLASNYMRGRKSDLINIKIGEDNNQLQGKQASFEGKLFQAGSTTPVEGATVYLEELKTGAVSDANGVFHLKLAPGKYSAKIECLGMEKIRCQFDVISDGSFELPMHKAAIDMKEVVIYGDRQMNIREKDPGMEKISVKSIKQLPMMVGESDILKVSEMLPGVVSVGEGSAGLNVRGGSFDQNAFYFNKIPIYNTSHMFGFFPAFNADLVSDFSLYKGYIPANYGGRLSSIFDIDTRAGNKKNYTAHGGISPIAGNLTIEGPLKKDTASFLISGRSSYSDWILRQIDDYLISNSKASFYDFSASVNYDLPKTQLNIFAYHSQDYFKLHDINTYWYSNSGGSATAKHQFSTSFLSEFSLSGVQYQFKTIDQQLEASAYEHQFKVGHYELKGDFQRIFNEKHQLDFGVNAMWLKLNRGDILPFGENSIKMPLSLGDEQGLEAALYISDSYDITPLLKLNAGFRFSAYTSFGPKDVYLYEDNSPMDVRNIKDTLGFGSGEPIKTYYFPEFRASLNYQTDEFGSIKLAFNQMHQSIFMLNNTVAVAPNSQWKLADYHLQPSTANQISLGVFRSMPRGGWEASAEVYYKSTKNYTEFKDGADFLSTSLVETTVLQGDQKSYGIELLLKRTGKRLGGWIAYTYSRSLIQVDGDETWQQINDGNIYPSNFDIPHVVNAILNYHISKRVTFSTTITYQTGKPATFPTSNYYIDGDAYVDYSKRNEYRIPDYFRTDVSLTVQGNLRKKKLLHSSFVFSVYNLTGRENPYSVYFTKEYGSINSYQYAVIGVPIITATWIFKLGNYDAH